jgi:hypothetical protein
MYFFMDHSLWSVLLKLVNNKTATPPQEWDEKGEAIFAIERMVGTSNPQELFQALDPKTKEAIWSILELARLEYDLLNFHRPPENRWLLWFESRSPLDRADVNASINKKSQLLRPLLDLSKAIQPTSPYERFLKTTADLMAHVSDQDRQSLDQALSECVRSMTRR